MNAVVINTAWCKGCGICVAFCPKKALSLAQGKAVHHADRCVACGMCELYCPDLAVQVDTTQKPSQKSKEAV